MSDLLKQVHNYDDLSPDDFKFVWKDHEYTLKEPSEAAVLAYRALQMRDARMVDNKVTSNVERIYESQSTLVASSLYHMVKNNKDGTETEQKMTAEVVRSFPARVVKDLFKRARDMAQLSEDDSEEALQKQVDDLQTRLSKLRESRDAVKNDSPGGTVT